MNKEMTRRVTVKLPDDLYEAAKEKSNHTGIPLSFVIRRALQQWVEKDGQEQEQEEEEETSFSGNSRQRTYAVA